MSRRNKTATICGIMLLMVIFVLGYLAGNSQQKPLVDRTINDNSDSDTALVPLVEGTQPEMLSPSYWTSPEGETLLFTENEVRSFRENNPAYVLTKDNRHLRDRELPDALPSEIVYSLLNKDAAKTLMDSHPYVNGEAAEESYWQELENNSDIALEEEVPLRFAICVERTMAMLLPTDDFLSGNQNERYCNDAVSAAVMPGSAVTILGESRDHLWYYILNGYFCGWVHAESLALCKDQAEWKAAVDSTDFLVVTAKNLILDQTAEPSFWCGKTLPMGTKLKLSETPADEINGRSTIGCYTAMLPVRTLEGTLDWETVAIPVSEDIHRGYLPMTSNAVIEQAFRFLGHVYGWGGSMDSNDCSGMVQQIYACFGLDLPRNSKAIAETFDLGAVSCKEMSVAKKLTVLGQMPAGTLLYMDGHIMIYLGMVDSKPYVISSCSSYLPPDAVESSPIINARCVFVSPLDLKRKNGQTWLESISIFDWKEY